MSEFSELTAEATCGSETAAAAVATLAIKLRRVKEVFAM